MPELITRAAVLVLVLFIGGCAITPEPFDLEEYNSVNQSDREAAMLNMPTIEQALTIEEAIARALKYNLEHRTRLLEQALAVGQFEASRFDMLPQLMANGQYTHRDEENIRRAVDSVTGLPSLSNPFITSERSHANYDVGLTWSLLDFGVSYYNARQNADRVLIAQERRRKVMHTLIQKTRSAFWRAAAAEKLGDIVKANLAEAEVALINSRKLFGLRIKSPREALRYQRNLLENLRLLESVERELSAARIELAGLIGVLPSRDIHFVEPAYKDAGLLDIPVDEMEEAALENNADLREQHYNTRIAATETRKTLLKLLPGISFNAGLQGDTDDFLINQQWNEAGLRVSFNLLNILSAPSKMKAADAAVAVQEGRRMALQMAVVTQVHMSRHHYASILQQYRRSNDIFDVDSQLSELALSGEASGTVSQLDRISLNVSTIMSSVRRYQAMAKVEKAASQLQATLGLEPNIGSVDEISLEDLTAVIRQEAAGSLL